MKRPQVNRVKKRLSIIHDVTAVHAKAAQEQHEVSCSKGCSACCRQVVTVSVFEALVILDWIASDKIRKDWYVKSILPKVKEQYEMCQKEEVDTDYWFENMIPCVFLKDDGLCSVYDVRPFPCRALYVITPKEYCSPPSGQLIGAVNFGELRQALLAEEVRLARHLDITYQQVPLPVALHWASIALFQGQRKLRDFLKESGFDDDAKSMIFWAKKFGDSEQVDEFLAEMKAKQEKEHGEANSSV